MLARLKQHSACRRPGAYQVAHGFVGSVRDPDRCQLAGTVQLGQHQRVAAIGLDAISCLDRDQRRGHDHTVMSTIGQQPMQSIATRAGFAAETQTLPAFAQPCREFAQDFRAVLENPDLPYLATAPAFGHCYANRRPVHIQPDIGDIINQARPPCMRLCADHPAQPSIFCMSRDGPPITQRTSGPIPALAF
jgi:hypothetical protein